MWAVSNRIGSGLVGIFAGAFDWPDESIRRVFRLEIERSSSGCRSLGGAC